MSGRVHSVKVLVDANSIALVMDAEGVVYCYNSPAAVTVFVPGMSLTVPGTLENGAITWTIVNPTRKQLLQVARVLVAFVVAQDVL